MTSRSTRRSRAGPVLVFVALSVACGACTIARQEVTSGAGSPSAELKPWPPTPATAASVPPPGPGRSPAPVRTSDAVWERRDFGVPAGNHPPGFAAAASDGTRVVAVGTRSTSVSSGHALLSHSPDGGRTWREAATGLPGDGPDALLSVDVVVHRRDQFIALGRRNGDGSTRWPPVVLTSRDGASWRVRPARGLDGAVMALAVGKDDQLIAVGTAVEAPAAWVSVNAETWLRLDGPRVRGFLDTVVVRGDLVLAAGSGLDGTLLARIAGTRWHRVEPPHRAATRSRSLAAPTDDVVLVTWTCSDDNVCRPSGWSSVDGRNWTPIGLPALSPDVAELTASGDVVYVLSGRELHRMDADGRWTAFSAVPLDQGQVVVTIGRDVCVVGTGRRDDLVGPAAACLRDA